MIRCVSTRSLCAALILFLPAGASPAAAQSLMSATKWRSIGPVNTGGRIDDIAVARVRGQPDAIYVATASGGLFKSANNGISWSPVFDGVDAMMSIGDVAVAPSTPQTVWVGTGEANTRQSSSWGDGVYKCTDGGKTWANMGLKDTRSDRPHRRRSRRTPNVVYVAAQGTSGGRTPSAACSRRPTADGRGRRCCSSTRTPARPTSSSIRANPQTLYAATYQRQRRTWGFNGGGPGSGIYKTTDGGATWTKLDDGLADGRQGTHRARLCRRRPARRLRRRSKRTTPNSGIYRTLDGGATWQKTSSLNTRPNYFSQIRVDPRDARPRLHARLQPRLLLLERRRQDVHRAVQQRPRRGSRAVDRSRRHGNHLIIGGDGGVSISWDRGQTWDFRRNMPIGQFYEIDVDNSVPFRICGGLQDNGVWCVPSAVRESQWHREPRRVEHRRRRRLPRAVRSGEQRDGAAVVAERQRGVGQHRDARAAGCAAGHRRRRRRGGAWRGAAARRAARGAGAASGYRWNWDTPIVVSHHDPKTWYMGAQCLFKSTDRGSSWKKISGDLTLNVDRDTLKMMGKRRAAGRAVAARRADELRLAHVDRRVAARRDARSTPAATTARCS